MTRLIPRDTEFVRGQFDYLKSNSVKGVVMETWDDWTEGSEFEPDTASGTSFLVSLRDNLANLYGEAADAAGDQRLSSRWTGTARPRPAPASRWAPRPPRSPAPQGRRGRSRCCHQRAERIRHLRSHGELERRQRPERCGRKLHARERHPRHGDHHRHRHRLPRAQLQHRVTAGATSTQNVQLSTSGKIAGNVTGNGAALSGGNREHFRRADCDQPERTRPTRPGTTTRAGCRFPGYTVTCSASGFVLQSQTATVATGATTTVNCAVLSPTCNEQPVITQPFDNESTWERRLTST